MSVTSIYPNYQPVRSRWVPRVPDHWRLLRAKNFLREIDDRSKTGEETLLSMRQHRGLVPHNDVSVKRIAPENLIGYKKAQPDELVLNRMQAGNAMFFRNRLSGLVSPDYAVFRLLRDDSPEYLGYLFRSWPIRGLFRSESKGLGTGTSGFLRLYSDRFAALEIPVPPRPEQDQIVAYLRAQDAHIARLIKAKRDLIGLLTEQKLRIIDHAVTRGLDASVALKPSGIDWLGDVPVHWDVSRLKYCVARIYSGGTPETGVDGFWAEGSEGIPWLMIADVTKADLVTTSKKRLTKEGLESKRLTLLPAGTVLYTMYASIGKTAVLGIDAAINQAILGLEPKKQKLQPTFLHHWLRIMERHVRNLASTSTQANLNAAKVKALPVFLPPISEQSSICTWIETECRVFIDAIERAEEEIKLIREYRDRLIADVVTGQVDVRGWVPGPDDVVAEEDLAALGGDEEIDTDGEEDDGDD